MITCPTCGAQNDPANRFCDQCGTRMDAVAGTGPTADVASQPTAAAATCPSCGAVVLPGEAFCDACGAALPAHTSAAAPVPALADAPTMLAPPSGATTASTASTLPGEAGGASTAVCPVCGHQNMPGDRFCDNCGADLQAPAPAVSSGDQTAVAAPDAVASSPPPAETAPPATESAQAPAEAVPPPAEPVATSAAPADQPAVPEPAVTAAEATTVPASAVTTTSAPDTSAERARLEDLIATQQRVIGQLEQTQSALGAATPAAILQTLQQARDALTQAQADLQALPSPQPAVDPAEVARLEEAVTTQQKIIGQLEQTQAALGAATPAAILQALHEAQSALTQAQADLQALTGTAASTAPVQAPVAAPTEAAPIAPPAVTAPTPAPARGPRLIIAEGDKELTLPADKAEIVIGREDPISQIFPEVDLTPFGGESGGVSRQHARLSHHNGQWTVTDLNSTNYTRVEGAKIDPNTPVPIQDGARLQFGRIATIFHT